MGYLSDFSRIALIGAKNYAWTPVVPINPQNSPGPRARHQSAVF
jgi:hypothetical protein